MIITYDLKGYPQFVYTAHDFAERKARKQPDIKQLANLLIRSIFEDGGLGRVLSIDEVTPGTPVNGWTIRFTGETNGRTADPYIAIYDGEVISYNDDPSRQSRDLSEGLALALDFAAKKGQKNCTKSKPCGGSCIAKGKSCRIAGGTISETQKKAADSLAKGKPAKAEPAKPAKAEPAKAVKVEVVKTKGKRTKADADVDKASAKEKKANADLDKANARIKQIEEDITKQRAIVAEMRKNRNTPKEASLDQQLAEQRKLNDLLREMPKAIEAQSAAEQQAFEAKADNLRQKIRREDREIKSIKNRLAWEDRNLYP